MNPSSLISPCSSQLYITRSRSISELAVMFDMPDHQGQSALFCNKYDNFKETAVEADDVMAAEAAAQQLVQMSEDSEDEVERNRPSTPTEVGSSTASSGRRRRDVKDDDDDHDEGRKERRCGVKRRKRFRSIRIIYMKTKPILEPSCAKRMRS